MKNHKKLKANYKANDELNTREKAEIVFLFFFVVLLAASVLAFIIAGLEVVEWVK